jgi:hypothetical protein
MKYNGLRKRSDYEDLLDGILNPKQIVKYPNRDSTNALNHPYLNQFRGEFDEMSEQDKAVKKAKVMLLAMQGLMAPTNTQGTNTNPPTNTAPQPPSSPSPSAYSVGSSFLNGISQTHNIMGGGATPGPSTLNSPRSSLYSESFTAMRPMRDFVNPTTNQDSRMYPAVSERDPNIASGSGHQVADAVHESIVETLTGAAAQRAAVTGGIFQEPPPLVTPQFFDIGQQDDTLLPQQSSSAAAASASAFRPTEFLQVQAAQMARIPPRVYTPEEIKLREDLKVKFKKPDRFNDFFTSLESRKTENQLTAAMKTIEGYREPGTNALPPFTVGDARLLANQLLSNEKIFENKGYRYSSRAPNTGQKQLTLWLFREFNTEFKNLLNDPIPK